MSQNGSMRRWFVGCEAAIRADDPQAAIRTMNALLATTKPYIKFSVYDGKHKSHVEWGSGQALGMPYPVYNVVWLTIVVANSPFNAASAARTIQLLPGSGITYRVTHLATGKVHQFVSKRGNGNG